MVQQKGGKGKMSSSKKVVQEKCGAVEKVVQQKSDAAKMQCSKKVEQQKSHKKKIKYKKNPCPVKVGKLWNQKKDKSKKKLKYKNLVL